MDRQQASISTGSEREGIGAHVRCPGAAEAVVIVDVEQCAAIRAAHGTQAGEQVTRAVSECLRRHLRAGDRLALLREDEFLAVLPGVGDRTLAEITARLREGIEGLRLALAGRVWSLSCTIGAAAAPTSRPRGLESLVRMADTELHRARRAAVGRFAG